MLDKKRLLVLLATAAILTATITPLNPSVSTTHQTESTPTRNPTTPPPQTQWNKTYGGTSIDIALAIQQTADGGYIAAGETVSFGAGGDLWLVKTDANGNHQWNKTYGGTSEEAAFAVQQTADGGYIAAGATGSSGAGSYDFWLVKTDANGNHQWNKTYGGANDDCAYSVQKTEDEGYIMAGYTESFGAGSADFWLVKIDSAGNHQWNKTYGGASYDCGTLSVQQTEDGGYIMAGYTESFGAGSADFWLVKTDADGNHQWNKTYGGANDDLAWSVRRTSDGGYIAAGYTESFGAGSADFWLVKTCDAMPPSTINDLTAGSPTSKSITLTWSAPGDDGNSGTAAGYVVKYSTSGAITDANWDSATTYTQSWKPLPAGTDETHAVLGLNPATTYWFAVKAYDDTPQYGEVSNSPGTWTLEGTPPAAIDDLTVSNPTSNSITLTWTAPGDDGMKGNAAGYIVKYSTIGCITAENWSSATTYPQSWKPVENGTAETHLVTGLTSETKYWFAIIAYDDASNYGGFSNSPSATTTPPPDTTAPAAIDDLTASNLNRTSITLTWTAPGDDGNSGSATGYVIRYSTSGSIDAANWDFAATFAQSWTPVKNGTLETRVVTGLLPGATYWFAVKAYDEASNYGACSNSADATTTSAAVAGVLPAEAVAAVGVAAVAVIAVVVFVAKRRK